MAAICTLLFFVVPSFGQVAVGHRFEGIALSADGQPVLSLTGQAGPNFRSYFDLFPIEGSDDLRTWFPLATVTRTNGITGLVQFTDLTATGKHRFYRTPTNVLVTPLPPLSGPYTVGTWSRLITDGSRASLLRKTNVRFMVTFWYPTQSATGALPVAYLEREMVPEVNQFLGNTFLNPAFFAHAQTNRVLAPDAVRWPVVLYSPSMNSHRKENIYKAEELASHGFIVAAMDHGDTFSSLFPDGQLVTGQPVVDQGNMAAIWSALTNRVADAGALYNELERLNNEDADWAGRLDLERIGAFGFSIGGAVAAQLCKQEGWCKAGLGMDGWFLDQELLASPVTRPFLFFRSDTPDLKMPDGRSDDRQPTIDAMERDGWFIQLSGTVHWSYSDMPVIAAPSAFQATFGKSIHPPLSGARVNQIVARYLVSFFDKHLRNEDDHLLDGPPSAFPEILRFIKR